MVLFINYRHYNQVIFLKQVSHIFLVCVDLHIQGICFDDILDFRIFGAGNKVPYSHSSEKLAHLVNYENTEEILVDFR